MPSSGEAAGQQQQQQQWHLIQQLKSSRLFSEVAVSGTGVACGTTVTNPIDVVKTRLQLHPATKADGPAPGMVRTAAAILRQEGVLALWKGWLPGVTRGILYGGLRLGLYNPIKEALAAHQQQAAVSIHSSSSSSQPSSIHSSNSSSSSSSSPSSAVSNKLLAGVASGSLAAALLSPTELIKVRLQAPRSAYSSASAAVAAVVAADGVKGLWKGATPGVVRAAVLTASQCVTYDEVKGRLMAATGWRDSAATHLATAMITGVVSTTATNPVDVIKTHMFVGGRKHAGPLSCAASLYAAHGLAGFWRGWLANYARLGPQTVVTFLVVEQLRGSLGMAPLGK
ncbi:hypothetical protein OEZ86_014723 [Tetradesmus obliquus]|nr:hypothetical protein OEZ86_014723 [Tetradesmus obliquus]